MTIPVLATKKVIPLVNHAGLLNLTETGRDTEKMPSTLFAGSALHPSNPYTSTKFYTRNDSFRFFFFTFFFYCEED